MKRVVIEITGDGKVTVKSQGFTGHACIEDLKWLDEILGTPTRRVFTDDYRKVEAIKIGRG